MQNSYFKNLIALLSILGIITANAQDNMKLPDFVNRISAGHIAVISDGDFTGHSYANGYLSPSDKNYNDVLSVLSITDGEVIRSEFPVSNSVTAAPEIMEITPDGRTIFVVERLQQRPTGGKRISDLRPGNRLFAINLSNAGRMQFADLVETGPFPEALAVNPERNCIAVVSNTSSESLIQLFPFSKGHFGKGTDIKLTDVVLNKGTDEPGKINITNVRWHPSGRLIAVNINTWDKVAFFKVSKENSGFSLSLWGNMVKVGRDPFVGRFTPDGRYYLTSNWGRNLTATNLDERLPASPSSISVIEVTGPDIASKTIRHKCVGNAETGMAAEGLAVSPDGKLVATVNMRGTVFPKGDPRWHQKASVTLLALDPDHGNIRKLDDYFFEGILPEGGTFDLEGKHFLATVFQGRGDALQKTSAGVEVFQVIHQKEPVLKSVGRIPFPHGAHHVSVSN